MVAAQASAADETSSDSRIRVGIAVGQVNLQSKNLADFDETSTGWNLAAGYEFNRYVALELGWLDAGKAVAEYAVAPGVDETDEVESHAWLGTVVATWPINDTVSIYGRGGLMSWSSTTRIKLNGALAIPETKDSGSDPYYGLGVAVHVDSGMIRLEYDLFSAGAKVGSTKFPADGSFVSLGVVWRLSL
jgi:hypothetical protein